MADRRFETQKHSNRAQNLLSGVLSPALSAEAIFACAQMECENGNHEVGMEIFGQLIQNLPLTQELKSMTESRMQILQSQNLSKEQKQKLIDRCE